MAANLHRIRARVVFYPTLWWNVLLGRRLKVRNWWDPIDEQVLVGAFPFPRDVQHLAALGVRAVVNTCEEYEGPIREYARFDIEQFRIPTTDFTHPLLDHVVSAVEFVDRQIDDGRKVYIHCKAGRARSATVAMCWLMKTHRMSPPEAQRVLLEKRPHINRRLAERPVVQQYWQSLGVNLPVD